MGIYGNHASRLLVCISPAGALARGLGVIRLILEDEGPATTENWLSIARFAKNSAILLVASHFLRARIILSLAAILLATPVNFHMHIFIHASKCFSHFASHSSWHVKSDSSLYNWNGFCRELYLLDDFLGLWIFGSRSQVLLCQHLEAVQSLASGEVDVGAAMMKHWLKARETFRSFRRPNWVICSNWAWRVLNLAPSRNSEFAICKIHSYWIRWF